MPRLIDSDRNAIYLWKPLGRVPGLLFWWMPSIRRILAQLEAAHLNAIDCSAMPRTQNTRQARAYSVEGACPMCDEDIKKGGCIVVRSTECTGSRQSSVNSTRASTAQTADKCGQRSGAAGPSMQRRARAHPRAGGARESVYPWEPCVPVRRRGRTRTSCSACLRYRRHTWGRSAHPPPTCHRIPQELSKETSPTEARSGGQGNHLQHSYQPDGHANWQRLLTSSDEYPRTAVASAGGHFPQATSCHHPHQIPARRMTPSSLMLPTGLPQPPPRALAMQTCVALLRVAPMSGPP